MKHSRPGSLPPFKAEDINDGLITMEFKRKRQIIIESIGHMFYNENIIEQMFDKEKYGFINQ